MKIILISIGTRGDMEPFLAIGEILKEKGHRVICAFPEQFRNLARDSAMEFASLGTQFIRMLDSDIGKAALGGSGSGFKKFLANVKLAVKQKEINKELVKKQYDLIEGENPDIIIYNGKAIYPVIWGLDHPGKSILVSPVPYIHYVKDHTHIAFNSNYGETLNKLTFSLVSFGMIVTVMITAKWLRLKRKISRKQIKDALWSTKTIYTISPSLFARPDSWNENIKVLGYQRRNKDEKRHSDQELNDFLKKHDRVLFITFGSMTNPDPMEKTGIIVKILERNKIPAIINTASGGLVKPQKFDSEWVYFVSQISYDRILPKIYGVIHHGGSGTTHMALKYGCATMIIPHIIDQFVWDKMVCEMGVGPKGIKISRISVKNLEPKILDLLNNPSYKTNARRVAARMEKENFKEEIYKSIIED